MDRHTAIETIENMFPVDAVYEDTAAIGRRLLQQAKEKTQGWRDEPDEVLIEYARLCIAEDDRQTRIATRSK